MIKSEMNARERMMAALEFRRPDKIPVYYHPSPAGFYVHGRKMLDLFGTCPADNPISFNANAAPDPKWVDGAGRYHEFRKDEWGTTWEYLIYGVAGHPKEYPFANWEEARTYVLPPIYREWTVPEEHRRHYMIFGGGGSLFWLPCSLRPFDETLVNFFEESEPLMSFVARLVDYYLEVNEVALKAGADVFGFGDDFGTQLNTFLPREHFQKIFLPHFRRLMEPLHRQGRKIMMHCCGCLDAILDDFFDLGIHLLWPQLSLYGRDERFLGRCAAHRVALLLHPDRQYLIPLGTPAEIRSWVRDMADRYRDGGGIFYIEIENDAPWDNVVALIESIAEYR